MPNKKRLNRERFEQDHSESECSDSNEGQIIRKKKKRIEKSFRKVWQDSWLKQYPWAQKIEGNPTKLKCTCCSHGKYGDKIINCGASELEKHNAGKKHQKFAAALKNTQTLEAFSRQEEDPEVQKVKIFEIKLSAFFAEHNVATSLIDPLIELLKNNITDSKIIKKVTLKRTKCTEIIENVIHKCEVKKLAEYLSKNYFSILVDESTDITDKKTMCVLARFINEHNRVQTQLLELIDIDSRDGSAASLYAQFKSCLDKYKIPVTNIIAMASDGANVMIGSKNSFYTHLQTDVPKVILMKCTCHTSALVASAACSELPMSLEELMRNVYTYISGSAKRCAQLKEMQEYFNNNAKHNILKLCNTRWLSMHKVVLRILENWTVLENFFRLAVVEDQLRSAVQILELLTSPIIKAYFFFLKYALKIFNEFNALFQSNKILIHSLYDNCMTLIKEVLSNFIKTKVIETESCLTINVKNPAFFLTTDKVFVGQECEEILIQLSTAENETFKVTCIKFYQKAAEEIQKRFLLFRNYEFLKTLKFLDPQIALGGEERNKYLPQLAKIAEQFKNNVKDVDFSEIEYEWKKLPLFLSEEAKEKMLQMEVDEF